MSAKQAIHSSIRQRVQYLLRFFALVNFGAMIIVLPFRRRFVLVERSLPPVYYEYTDVVFYLSDIFLIGTFVFWFFHLIIKTKPINFGPWFLFIPIVGLIFLSGVSIFHSTDRVFSSYNFVRLLMVFGIYLFTVNEIRSFNMIVLPVGLQLFFQAIVGIGQGLSQFSLGLLGLGEHVLFPTKSGASVVSADGIRLLRAYGLTDHPNIFGGSLVFALIIITTWYIEKKDDVLSQLSYHFIKEKNDHLIQVIKRTFGEDPLIISLFVLGSLALFLSFSRSAWLAFGAGFTFICGLSIATNQKILLIKGGVLLLGGFLMILPMSGQYFEYIEGRIDFRSYGSSQIIASEERALVDRQFLNQVAVNIISENPQFGIGLSVFPIELREKFEEFPINYQPVHVVLLDIAAETGILNAINYLILVFAPWLALLYYRGDLRLDPPLIGVSGALIAITIVGFFDYYPWMLAPGRGWQWLIWGLWGATFQKEKHV